MIIELPFLSVVILHAPSQSAPPALFAQSSFPEGSYFAIKISLEPELYNSIVAKDAVPSNHPVTKTFPNLSVDTACATS